MYIFNKDENVFDRTSMLSNSITYTTVELNRIENRNTSCVSQSRETTWPMPIKGNNMTVPRW